MGITYRQEYYEGETEDMAEIIHLNETVAIDNGSYDNVLVTREWTPLEPDVEEYKYYAPGIGLIFESGERLELIELIPTFKYAL